MSRFLSSFQKTIADVKGSIINSAIVAGTVAFEELLNHAVYYCPCIEPSELVGPCNSSTSNSRYSRYECTPSLNIVYGVVFLAIPALVLFILSVAAHPSIWKICTGRSRTVRAKKDKTCTTCLGVIARSLIAPMSWVSYGFLDGKYFACCMTPTPYHISSLTNYKTCQDVAQLSSPAYSDAYRDNRSLSQIIGWILLGIIATLSLCLYAVSRCCHPLTYYHAKYYDLYRMHEENEFDDEMNKKAQLHAEENVKKFMSKHRTKALWDRISTIFEFHRNRDEIALYSYLHEFILEEEKEPGNRSNSIATNASGMTMDTVM